MGVINFGTGQMLVKFDDSYSDNLFAIQGETARTYHFIVTDLNNQAIDTSNINLKMNVFIKKTKAGTAKGVRQEDNSFLVTIPQGLILEHDENAKYQIFIQDDNENMLSQKEGNFKVFANRSFDAGSGTNLLFDFVEFKKALDMQEEYLKQMSDNLDKTIVARTEAQESSEKAKASEEESTRIEIRLTDVFTSETERIENEKIRVESEEERKSSENTRIEKESIRISSETERIENEKIRQKNNEIVEGWIANPNQFKGPKGDIGPKGDKGEKGDRGEGLEIIGSLNSESELPKQPKLGDAYLIQGELWIFEKTGWKNAGTIQGPKGEQGLQGPPGEGKVQSVNGKIGEVQLYSSDIEIDESTSTTISTKLTALQSSIDSKVAKDDILVIQDSEEEPSLEEGQILIICEVE